MGSRSSGVADGQTGAPGRGGESPARLGRPPRVTPEQIAEAALEIGLEQATIRRVADRLGMSVPGLYHHVRTRDELLALAAAHSMGQLPLPDDVGQPWTEWLLDYGRFVYDALVEHPEIVGQIMAGTFNTLRLAQHLERIFAVLTSRGFTVEEAFDAQRRLTAAVTGAAVADIGQCAMIGAGHPRHDDLTHAVHTLGAANLPLVNELITGAGPGEPDPFDTVRLVVDAIAASRR